MKIKDIALSAAAIGERVVKAIAIGAVEVWSAIKYIVFKDKAVEQICATKWGDGVGITEEQAAAVTDIGLTFRNNTEITSFDEISKFGVKKLQNSNGAFLGCSNLKSIDLQNMEVIADNSFQNCTSLSSPIIAPKLTSIGTYMVFAKTQIEEILDLGVITSIGGSTFNGCSKLRKVVLPVTCKTLSTTAFTGLAALEDINLEHIETIGQDALVGLTSFVKPLVNEHIKTLGSCGNSGFTECDCPNVETVSDYAFYGCPNFGGTLNFPKLKKVGTSAFYNTKITRIISLGEVTEIGMNAFAQCAKLEYAVLPKTITTLGSSAFIGCSKMVIEDVNLPNLTSFGDAAFRYCDIRRVSSLGSAKTITTFDGNKNLTYVYLHEGVTTLGYGTFMNCSSLPNIELPSTITSIGQLSFANCKALQSIICKAVTPPTVGAQLLEGANSSLKIYVPDQSLEAYKTATNWSAYASRIKPLSEYTE